MGAVGIEPTTSPYQSKARLRGMLLYLSRTKNLGSVGAVGIEPTTSSLSEKRSTTELRAQILKN